MSFFGLWQHVDHYTSILGKHTSQSPNVVVEWITLLVGIWDVLGSNLGLETGHSD
jgi:hypothetical protein